MCQNLANSYKCFDITYNEKKSTWSNFNILHGNIWTKENLMHGTKKLFDEFFWKY
jgi:hypothetical protein